MDNRTGAVRLSGCLLCASIEEVEIVKRYLPDHHRLTNAEPGCLSFEVLQTDDPLVWRVEELFVDRDAFDLHQQRTRTSVWFTVTSSITRDYSIAEPGQR
jgi:quinol monooxygenase YgiN